MNIKQSILALALVGGAASFAQAATFYTISGVTSDTSASDLWAASNLIQGAGTGFDAATPHASLGGTGSSTAWVTTAPNGGASDYFGPTPPPGPRLVFDLGSVVPLGEISIWGYNSSNANGASSVDLRFSSTPTFSGAPVSIPGVGLNPDTRQSFTFAPINAQYVEFVPTDNHFGGAVPGGDRIGLREVAFEVVPEPSGTLLGLVGIAALALRRRRN